MLISVPITIDGKVDATAEEKYRFLVLELRKSNDDTLYLTIDNLHFEIDYRDLADLLCAFKNAMS